MKSMGQEQMPKAICVHGSAGEVRVVLYHVQKPFMRSVERIGTDPIHRRGVLKCTVGMECLSEFHTLCEGSGIPVIDIKSSPADDVQLRRNCEIPRKPGRFFRVGGRWDFRFF